MACKNMPPAGELPAATEAYSEETRACQSGTNPNTSRVETHYDAQANTTASREACLQARGEGRLKNYKDFANKMKRRLIDTHLRGDTHTLIDLACGRGGDLMKWRCAGVRRVLALDLSAQQLTDAEGRQARESADGGPDVCWLHGSMTAPGLEAQLRAHGGVGADGISIMFAVQFACGAQRQLDELIGVIARLLKPGGTFFGAAPDGDAIAATIGGASEYRSPADSPFGLLLRLLPRSTDPTAGQPLIFSLEDTVTSGSDASGCVEYLCRRDDLAACVRAHGLECVEMRSLADDAAAASLTAAEVHVAQLYFTFAFRKPLDAPRPRLGVAVYTGSFDPVHENHIALCKHVLAERGLSRVYLVCNGENPTKPGLSPLRARAHLVDLRLAEPDCAGIRRHETDVKLVWRGRHEVCQRIKEHVRGEYGGRVDVEMYQILGQDAFEDRGGFRDEETRRQFMRGRTMLVLPRSTSAAAVDVPAEWARDVTIEVLRSYVDPDPQLSSSRLRPALADPFADDAAVPAGIHPTVWRAARARRLYMRSGAPSAHRLNAILVGAPFSGKTSLATELLRRVPRLRYVAGGDLHRAASLALREHYGHDGSKLGDKLRSEFLWACQAAATRRLAASGGVDAIITDVKPSHVLPSEYHRCQAQRLAAFEPGGGTPAPYAHVGFDVVGVLEVDAETLRSRAAARRGRVGDVADNQSRVSRALPTPRQPQAALEANQAALDPNQAALEALQPFNPDARAALLDSSRTTDSLADELEGWLRAAAVAKGLDLGRPEATAGPATSDECAAFCREVVLAVWDEGRWLPAAPPSPAAGDRQHGSVKCFSLEKGYGFILPDGGGKDVYVHATKLVDGNALSRGARVCFRSSFDPAKGKPCAEDVTGAYTDPRRPGGACAEGRRW